MIRRITNLLALAGLLVYAFMFAGCSDKEYFKEENEEPDVVGDIPSKLDFSTTQKIVLQFNYNGAPRGLATIFDVYTEYPLAGDGTPRTDLSPIASGIYVIGSSNIVRVIPAYVKELYLYSSTMFVPMLSHATVAGGVASFAQVDVVLSDTDTRAGNAGTFWKTPIAKYLKSAEDYYMTKTATNTQYDLISPDYQEEIPLEITSAIASTFPEGKIVDEKYYKDATIKIQKGKDGQTGAEVFVTMLHSGAGFWNSLSYFVYEGKTDLTALPKEQVQAFEVITIFQYADVNTNTYSASKRGNYGLTPGKYIQLLYKNANGEYVKEFPVGAQIGWVLHPNAFKSSDFNVLNENNMARIFSVSYWNDPRNKTINTDITGERTNNYTIFFSAIDDNGRVFNCFGFEDQPGTASDGDCNDVVFHLLTNPSDAIAPPPSITEEELVTTESKKGTLAFEDYWPQQGDYDLNDVVVKYNSTITYGQVKKTVNGASSYEDVCVKQVEDKFSFIHTGAAYNNAFSYKMSVPVASVKSVTVKDENRGSTTDYTSEITADGDGFILDLCPNVRDVIKAMEFVTTPQNYTVVVEFTDGSVLQDGFATIAAPYNPFICPKMDQTVEVHLPMYLPTGRANLSLLGTGDDRSDKNTLWYVSGENNKYPFAIHLSGAGDDFTVPAEEVKIDVTYPKYKSWVESGMTTDQDWYK